MNISLRKKILVKIVQINLHSLLSKLVSNLRKIIYLYDAPISEGPVD